MRVSQSEVYRNFTSDITSLNKSLTDVNEQISSGKKLNDLADSPGGSADLVAITDESLRLEMYRKNIDTSSYYLQSADSALNEANNLVSSIFTLGQQASSETVSDETRSMFVSQLRELREQLISLGNTQANGRYLFAGSAVDSAPFALSGDSVGYSGNDEINQVAVSDGVEVPQGVLGSKAFNSVFGAIDTLIYCIEGNDIEGTKASLEQFAGAMGELSQARGEVGANLSLVQNLSGTLDSKKAILAERKSNIEDADMVASTVQLSQLKTALDGALSAGGAILQQSNLFDILG